MAIQVQCPSISCQRLVNYYSSKPRSMGSHRQFSSTCVEMKKYQNVIIQSNLLSNKQDLRQAHIPWTASAGIVVRGEAASSWVAAPVGCFVALYSQFSVDRS